MAIGAKRGRPPKVKNNGHLEPDVEAQEQDEQAARAKVAAEMEDILSDDDAWGGPGFGSIPTQGKLGVLQRMVTAVASDEQYRQILLLAAFDNKQEALLASDAIAERQRYGVNIKPILDRVVAQCAVKADLRNSLLRAMSQHVLSTQWTTNKQKNNDRQELST